MGGLCESKMTEGFFYLVAGELIMCGLLDLYEIMRQEREEPTLPPGVYRLSWGSLTEGR